MDNKLGSKTKILWQNPDYRRHMSKAHEGQKAWNKGLPFELTVTEDVRKIRKLKISRGLIEAYKSGKRKPIWKSREFPLSAKIKISLSQKGDKHWNWKGGITKKRDMRSLLVRTWREGVFQRDNYTCQECKKRGGELNAHHKKSWARYPELRFDIDNGETLCKPCHWERHSCKS